MAISRALISVSNKDGLVEFARALSATGVELLSTGGTARALRDAGLNVVDVATYTGSPEVMDGRVKTLHPKVHGGLLMRDTDADRADLNMLGGKPIDLVVVNLYPFESTVARGAPYDEVVENIDIGGPSMVRSAAKNHARVTVVVDPSDYARVAATLNVGGPDISLRRELAAKAFSHTAAYDGAIANHFTSLNEALLPQAFSRSLALNFDLAYGLRYGENPHQKAAFYVERNAPAGSLARAQSIGAGGKELSYNNLVDCEAALDAVREFEAPAAVVVKHTNPCGVATRSTIAQAYHDAREADALSAFGGIVAVNREVDADTAKLLAETFLECVVAPSYCAEALQILHAKKNLRLLATGAWLPAEYSERVYRRVGGGLLVQDRDAVAAAELLEPKIVTARVPNPRELRDLNFAWRVCKHVKSNAIVFAKNETTVGVGAGQMSRVVSVEIAAKKAGDHAKGAVLASDAFFPFPDGVEAAAAAGITAIVQPGGSVKDADVIAAADAAGVAMIFTGVRHFRH